jgi:hypothetical protein
MNVIEISQQDSDGHVVRLVATALTIVGWTARNANALQHHLDELAAIGVAPPKEVPVLYRVAAVLLTTAASVEVVGNSSSGEAEFCLINVDGKIYVAVGSDHTDRALEAHDITLSKQICAKPVSRECWRFDEVEGHWDQLMLRSFATKHGVERLYQEGSVAEILHPRDLIKKVDGRVPFKHGSVVFGGTVPVKGPVTGSDSFRVELHDPVLRRTLRCAYQTRVL